MPSSNTADEVKLRVAPQMQVIAQTRAPEAEDQFQQIDAIRAQDADLQPGQFGTVYFKSVTVAGVELKLEPLQPSIARSIPVRSANISSNWILVGSA